MHHFHFVLLTVLVVIIADSSIYARNVPPYDQHVDESEVDESSQEHEVRRSVFNVNESVDSSQAFQWNTTASRPVSTINDTLDGSTMSNGTTSRSTETDSSIAQDIGSSEETVSNKGNGTESAQEFDEQASNNSTITMSEDADSTGSKNSSVEVSSAGSSSNSTDESESGDLEDSNNIPNTEAIQQRVVELREKVKEWQSAVSDYLQTTRHRRQTDWNQLLQGSSSSSGTASNHDQTNQLISAAGTVVGDALKPAMELMGQGIDLLSDLYSTQFTKPTGRRMSSTIGSSNIIVNENTTAAVDQFRGQMESLQTRLSDLGRQLQKVVGTFQDMQVPFLDGLMASGGLGNLGAFGNMFSPNLFVPPAQAPSSTDVQQSDMEVFEDNVDNNDSMKEK